MTTDDDSPGSLTQPEGAGAAPGASRRPLYVAIAGLLAFVALAALGYRWAQSDALATLVSLDGSAQRDTAQQLEQWLAAEVGDGFAGGDGARTPEGATAHFRLSGGARLRLEPSSQIRFHRRPQAGGLRLDVELGQVDVESADGLVSIDSEFGEIALDPGSAITMRRNEGRLTVRVDLGSIEIGDERRALRAGESVELEIGGILLDPPPAEPALVEPEPEPEPERVLDPGNGIARHDLIAPAGQSFSVHDPSPPTAVGFALTDACTGPARLTASGQTTEAAGQANLSLPEGRHFYELRCLDRPGVVAAEGQVVILRDSGTRQLPSFAPKANVSTDGRRYTVMYQHRLPSVTVSWPTAPRAPSYVLDMGSRKIETSSATHTFASLGRGTHQVTFSAATTPARRSRTTTIEVVLDTQAPTARVSDPPSGFQPGQSVTVGGQALPGWEVSVGGRALPVDARRRFRADVPALGPLPIVFSHPRQGVHYYLRRPHGASP